MKQIFCVLIMAFTSGLWADSYGEISLSSTTSAAFADPFVFPSEFALDISNSSYVYPTDSLSLFFDSKAAAGFSLSAGEVDVWFAESLLAADGTLLAGNVLFQLGTDFYVYSETGDTSYIHAEVTAAATGGWTRLGWFARGSVPIAISSTVDASFVGTAGVSFSPVDVLIMEPALQFTSPNRPGISARITWFGRTAAVLDLEASYEYEIGAAHHIAFSPRYSLLISRLGAMDITIGVPGLLEIDDSAQVSDYAFSPSVTAGIPLGGSFLGQIDIGAEFTSSADPYGYLTGSLIFKY